MSRSSKSSDVIFCRSVTWRTLCIKSRYVAASSKFISAAARCIFSSSSFNTDLVSPCKNFRARSKFARYSSFFTCPWHGAGHCPIWWYRQGLSFPISRGSTRWQFLRWNNWFTSSIVSRIALPLVNGPKYLQPSRFIWRAKRSLG